jgi:hydroxyacylglutathione hydrolase
MKVIQQFLKNPLRNFNYIITSEHTDKAVFFDPFDFQVMLDICEKEGKVPGYLLITHDHPDHIRHKPKFLDHGVGELLELVDGEEFYLSDNEIIKAVSTPGHVMNHLCYYLYEGKKLVGIITGDTIFNAGIGNCKLGGDPNIYFKTFKSTFTHLADDIKIYPSHDYLLANLKFSLMIEPDNLAVKSFIERREQMDLDEEFIDTTIGDEKKINPFFRVFQNKFFAKYDYKTEEEFFVDLRAQRDKW